ncbi:MAG: pimeloyl-CoA dehydrogenase large subunit [Alphaproteobacteria bacterium]|nr:pimeloyl-CoA dehydrogenase large subunit [Alphaproteobacteria bacterium]
MDLQLSRSERAFKKRIEDFLAAKLPAKFRERIEKGKGLGKQDQIAWQKILYEEGLIAPAWPKKYGGAEMTAVQRYLLDQTMAENSAPQVVPFGVTMVGPVIYSFGNEAQKARFLPRILRSDDWWCQGYSEPGSGSDLASLRTKAERQGDHYIVNGQKTWTTLAQHADWIFCLVRTDSSVKQQEGISFLLIDMKTPGITVRPIITMEGGHEVNDVFFDNVKVPAENLIGQENKGWTYAKYLLGHERFGTAAVARSKRNLGRLRRIAAEELSDGKPLIEDTRFKTKVSQVEIDLLALEYTELRYLMQVAAGKPIGPEVSMLKIRGTQIQQAITELTMEACAYYAFPFVPESGQEGWNEEPIGPAYAATSAPVYFNWRKSSIYGGSNEIQRNIISKMVLGL